MPIHNQLASIAAWSDEEHVQENRAAYRAKFEAVVPILREVMNVDFPDAGFYLWPETPMDDETFARELSAPAECARAPRALPLSHCRWP